MKNFELLRKDWAGFTAGSSGQQMIMVEEHITDYETETAAYWLSPIGQPDVHLCPRDLMEALGLAEYDFKYLCQAAAISLCVICPITYQIEPYPTGDVRVSRSSDTVVLSRLDAGFITQSNGGYLDGLIANSLDNPFHFEP